MKWRNATATAPRRAIGMEVRCVHCKTIIAEGVADHLALSKRCHSVVHSLSKYIGISKTTARPSLRREIALFPCFRLAKGFVTDTIRVFFLAPKRLWGRDHWRQIQQLQYGKHICIGWQRLQLATSLPSNHRSDTAIPCVGPFPHKPMVSVGAIHTRRYFLCACQMFCDIPCSLGKGSAELPS